jgi:hypothetical protein
MKTYIGTGLPVGVRRRSVRPTMTAIFIRKADRFITSLQEWLERDDTALQKWFAYAVVIMALLYFAAAVVRSLA